VKDVPSIESAIRPLSDEAAEMVVALANRITKNDANCPNCGSAASAVGPHRHPPLDFSGPVEGFVFSSAVAKILPAGPISEENRRLLSRWHATASEEAVVIYVDHPVARGDVKGGFGVQDIVVLRKDGKWVFSQNGNIITQGTSTAEEK
jgi:hypothetical protein